jgi:hypothetical protein
VQHAQKVELRTEVLGGFWQQLINISTNVLLAVVMYAGTAVVSVLSLARRQWPSRLRNALVILEPCKELAFLKVNKPRV